MTEIQEEVESPVCHLVAWEDKRGSTLFLAQLKVFSSAIPKTVVVICIVVDRSQRVVFDQEELL